MQGRTTRDGNGKGTKGRIGSPGLPHLSAGQAGIGTNHGKIVGIVQHPAGNGCRESSPITAQLRHVMADGREPGSVAGELPSHHITIMPAEKRRLKTKPRIVII